MSQRIAEEAIEQIVTALKSHRHGNYFDPEKVSESLQRMVIPSKYAFEFAAPINSDLGYIREEEGSCTHEMSLDWVFVNSLSPYNPDSKLTARAKNFASWFGLVDTDKLVRVIRSDQDLLNAMTSATARKSWRSLLARLRTTELCPQVDGGREETYLVERPLLIIPKNDCPELIERWEGANTGYFRIGSLGDKRITRKDYEDAFKVTFRTDK
ncbi:MAG: hypothetical protein WC796_04240 [Candidatus Pacearchaeota archaeon]|jgi:hypothetical protein